MVLGYQGAHIVAVTVGNGYIRRLITTPDAITSLQVATDPAENITITYTDQYGPHVLRLDSKRKALPPR